MELVVFV